LGPLGNVGRGLGAAVGVCDQLEVGAGLAPGESHPQRVVCWGIGIAGIEPRRPRDPPVVSITRSAPVKPRRLAPPRLLGWRTARPVHNLTGIMDHLAASSVAI
jgi:hypothetical protein